MSPQCVDVLAWIGTYGSITAADAVKIGIYRLASRIFDLRKAGYNIIKVMERGKNHKGEVVYYARYFMGGKI